MPAKIYPTPNSDLSECNRPVSPASSPHDHRQIGPHAAGPIIVARCVRRSFLWGFDIYSNQNYDHRKAWVEQRILLLSNAFAIVELCGDVKPPASGDCESTSSSNGVVGS